MTWPADWSADVVEVYASLARERGWPSDTIEAVASNAQYIRGLDESERPRQHFAGDFDGEQWLFEAVEDRGELIVIRQILIAGDGRSHRYSWRWLDDDDGGLTDQALDPADGPAPTTAAHFEVAWGGAGPGR